MPPHHQLYEGHILQALAEDDAYLKWLKRKDATRRRKEAERRRDGARFLRGTKLLIDFTPTYIVSPVPLWYALAHGRTFRGARRNFKGSQGAFQKPRGKAQRKSRQVDVIKF